MILVRALPEDATGEATFNPEFIRPRLVRAVTLADLRKEAKKMVGAEGKHFSSLLALRDALQAHDDLALANAKKMLEHAYDMRESKNPPQPLTDQDSDRQFGDLLAARIGLSAEEAVKHFEGLRPGPKASSDARRLLSYEVSESVDSPLSRIVLWWNGEAFVPAIYCTDMATALYVHTFLVAPAGARGFRMCPQCTQQFFQDRSNQDYCCTAHREAHRVARWRHAAKQDVSNGKGKHRRKNVTKKTR